MDRQELHRQIRELTELSYSRSGGPGGQNVNKRDTKVTARLEITALDLSSPAEADRLHRNLGDRISADGRVVIQSEKTRSQGRNREDALERMEQLISAALRPDPRPRKATRPSRAARERRLEGKKQRSRIKSGRRRPDEGD